jgi:hypothetical protein
MAGTGRQRIYGSIYGTLGAKSRQATDKGFLYITEDKRRPAMPQQIHKDKMIQSVQRLEWALPCDKIMTVLGGLALPQDVVVSKNGTQYDVSRRNLQ